MTMSQKANCGGVFCGDRALLISEFADNEYRLACDLAAVRLLLHLAVEQLHETRSDLSRSRAAPARIRQLGPSSKASSPMAAAKVVAWRLMEMLPCCAWPAVFALVRFVCRGAKHG